MNYKNTCSVVHVWTTKIHVVLIICELQVLTHVFIFHKWRWFLWCAKTVRDIGRVSCLHQSWQFNKGKSNRTASTKSKYHEHYRGWTGCLKSSIHKCYIIGLLRFVSSKLFNKQTIESYLLITYVACFKCVFAFAIEAKLIPFYYVFCFPDLVYRW